jgi:hypothetical protein
MYILKFCGAYHFASHKLLDTPVRTGVHTIHVPLAITKSRVNLTLGFHSKSRLMVTTRQNLWTLHYVEEESAPTLAMGNLTYGSTHNMWTGLKMKSRMLAAATAIQTLQSLLTPRILMTHGLIAKMKIKIPMSRSMSVLIVGVMRPPRLANKCFLFFASPAFLLQCAVTDSFCLYVT